MCLELPAFVMEVDADGMSAIVRANDRTARVLLLALDAEREAVQPGDWLLVHTGIAVQRISSSEAADLLDLISQAGRAAEGTLTEPGPGGTPRS
jgi:hydrogenase expression/formation protein HypC